MDLPTGHCLRQHQDTLEDGCRGGNANLTTHLDAGRGKEAEFTARSASGSWTFASDSGRWGWVASGRTGAISFALALGAQRMVELGFLRSYEKMGKLKVTGKDEATGKSESKVFDSLWKKKISVYTEEDIFISSGTALLTVETIDKDDNPLRENGNKVKLLAVLAYPN